MSEISESTKKKSEELNQNFLNKKRIDIKEATLFDHIFLLLLFISPSRVKRYLTHETKYLWLPLFTLQLLFIAGLSVIIWHFNPNYFPVTGNRNYDFSVLLTLEGIVVAAITYIFLRWVPPLSVLESTCFYYSVGAANFLEQRKFDEGGFYVGKLISYMNQYSKIKNAEIEGFKVRVKALFHDKIENLCDHKQEVAEAVRQSGDLSKGFADNLYNLASSLFSVNVNIKETSRRLSFLVDNCQDYFQEDSFLLKHKSTNTSLKGLYDLLPILVPIITTVLAAVLPIIIHG